MMLLIRAMFNYAEINLKQSMRVSQPQVRRLLLLSVNLNNRHR